MFGNEAKLNEESLHVWGAELLDFKVGAVSYSDSYLLPPKTMIPVKLSANVGLRNITITLDFSGNNMHEIIKHISDFTATIMKESELILPDGFYYTCVYTGADTPTQKAPWIWQTTFSLVGYRHGYFIEEELTATDEIIVEGNFKTPIIITISGATNNSWVSVNGIKVKNIAGTVVIDGYDKTVMQNGQNKFADVELTSFPAIDIGEQTISIAKSTGSPTITIGYYPIYI